MISFLPVLLTPLLLLPLSAAIVAAQAAQEDVTTIIQKSVEANNRDWDADPQYSYTERDLDHDGHWKTYSVTDVLGTPYERLIAINGEPLSASEKTEQQRKYEEMLSQRKSESPEQHSQRVAKFQAERRRDHAMLDELTKAFDFHLQGERKFGRYTVYLLDASPRRGYKPPNRDAEVLTGMDGRLWIDKKTYQWVKVEAHVIHPVAIDGFMAQVERGTRFELEKAPVAGNIWLTTHYAMKASAKVLYLVPHHSQEEDFYTNYHRQPTPASDATQGGEQKSAPSSR